MCESPVCFVKFVSITVKTRTSLNINQLEEIKRTITDKLKDRSEIKSYFSFLKNENNLFEYSFTFSLEKHYMARESGFRKEIANFLLQTLTIDGNIELNFFNSREYIDYVHNGISNKFLILDPK